MEEVLADIDAISSDPEHRDQFKALKMLASTQSSSVVLNPPMGESEILDRLSRVMKPAGPNRCQLAFARAFPRSKQSVGTTPELTIQNLSEESIAIIGKVFNLKSLYREFPAIKRHGMPSGFPAGKGTEAKLQWCKREAEKMLLVREKLLLEAPVVQKEVAGGTVGEREVGPAVGDGPPEGVLP